MCDPVHMLVGGMPLDTDGPLELSNISHSARKADPVFVGVLERAAVHTQEERS